MNAGRALSIRPGGLKCCGKRLVRQYGLVLAYGRNMKRTRNCQFYNFKDVPPFPNLFGWRNRSNSHMLTKVSGKIPRVRACASTLNFRVNRYSSSVLGPDIELNLMGLVPVVGKAVAVPEISDLFQGARF